jgi:HlyD family secretion protein
MSTLTRRQRSAALALVLVAGAGAGLWLGLSGATGSDPPRPAPSATATRAAVAALGRIEPRSEIIDLAAGAPDRLVSLSVKRGDKVRKDQVLGYLQRYYEHVAEREQLQAELAEAKARQASAVALDQARIAEAEIKLKEVTETMPMRIAAQEATVAAVQASLANDQSILDSDSKLARQSYTSQRALGNQRTAVLRQQRELAAEQARLEGLRRQFAIDRLDAEAQLRLAQAGLEHTRADYPILSLEKQIALTEVLAHNATIYAPIDGTILNVYAWPGEQVGEKPILAMGDTSAMRVVAEVYETDIAQVRLGQRATVQSRALAHPVTGRVVEIGQMIYKNDVLNVDPAAKTDARIVEVRIELDDAVATEALTNLQVDVLIEVAGGPIPEPAVAGVTP